MTTKQALIIFAKLPRTGEVKTRLGRSIGMEQAAEAYKRLAAHAFANADEMAAAGVRVYVFYAPGASRDEFAQWVKRPFVLVEQEGATLGERMRNSFDRAFADGSAETVIIGTDVPELDAPTLYLAFRLLATYDVVLGPSTDGGYYLLGMKPPTKDLFRGVDWSTHAVFDQTQARLQALHLSTALLHELTDVDTEEDYKEYMRRQRTLEYRNRVR